MSKNKYPFALPTEVTLKPDNVTNVIVLNQVSSANNVTVINNGSGVTNNISNTTINNISNQVEGDLFVNGSIHIRPTNPNVPSLILSGAVEIVDGVFPNKVPDLVKPSIKIGNLGILGENKKEDDIKVIDLGDFC